ncbi:hypothetical protein BT96DRAFT_1017942 [Gymnopus androsaceus JB14]|uniref:Uncharacterized protein n=1 Tax=Gymnopus androsaceus JB14 TaxID=1447944 RepID=A0A6A4HVT1_9AGAR|nr:hypothetical protein BT96DRAFT_1017942 [Gymnopus androsaceus JB14]
MPLTSPPQDELTSTVFDALQNLVPTRKATFLLDTALTLTAAGQYGPQVENYFDVYLRTPNLPKEDVVRALLARGNARKAEGANLLEKAQQDYETVLKLDPSNKDLQHLLGRNKLVPKFISTTPASQRAPPEIWERIAYHIPRYHLRSWLFVSPFHREIAVRIIFHTLDLYFGEDPENLNKGLDIFDRAKNDSVFAMRVKSLRLHWAYEEGDMLDLMIRLFRTALPEFKALEDFEWIGYPEMRAEMVQAILKIHSGLHGLGSIGWHFDATGISSFTSLRKFTLRAEDDDGEAPMSEIPLLLDTNFSTLKHLVLAAYLARPHSWDMAFQSYTLSRLTHLDLVDTRISHYVLGRILGAAGELRSLTLHGTIEESAKAAVLFGGDQVVPGPNGEDKHTFLPFLESFRFLMVAQDEPALYTSVIEFLRRRPNLRRLDLGGCPWHMVLALLRGKPQVPNQPESFQTSAQGSPLETETEPDSSTSAPASTSFGATASFLSGSGSTFKKRAAKEPALDTAGIPGLRTLGVRMGNMTEVKVQELVSVLPREMISIGLWAGICDRSMNAYAPLFKPFHQLSFLHLQSSSQRRPKPNLIPERDFQRETDLWHASARSVACVLPTLDFVGWHREHYVVVRNTSPASSLPSSTPLPLFTSGSSSTHFISEPTIKTLTPVINLSSSSPVYANGSAVPTFCLLSCEAMTLELKELPSRRRLDCGKGVDLGTDDAAWLERKDVPMDYEEPGLE